MLFVGKIDRNKNVISIQKAMYRLKKKGINLTLTVVGDKSNNTLYKKISKDSNTTIYNFMPKDQLLKIYRNHDIFVMPSHNETFGLVYAEAISQGLPVIYTKNQGFDRQYKNGEVGFAINSKSIIDIADNILALINNYNNFNNNFCNKIDVFNWYNIAVIHYKIYKQE